MKEEDNEFEKFIIIGLGKFNHNDFMDIFYHLLESSPGEILAYDEEPNIKIEKLNYILKYYEDKEEYEKCVKIKNVQQMIKNSIGV